MRTNQLAFKTLSAALSIMFAWYCLGGAAVSAAWADEAPAFSEADQRDADAAPADSRVQDDAPTAVPVALDDGEADAQAADPDAVPASDAAESTTPAPAVVETDEPAAACGPAPAVEPSHGSDAPTAADPAPPAPSAQPALALLAVHDDVITQIEAEYMDGSGPVGTVGWSSAFRLEATFALPDGQVHAGDTTTITLPDELAFYRTAGFAITDEDGNVVANAVIDGPAKTITLTYTDYPDTHSKVSGRFHFYVRVDHAVVTEEQDIDLVFDVSGAAVFGGTIHSGPVTAPSTSTLTKSGWHPEGSDPRVFNHTISVNRAHIAIGNAVLTDAIQTTDTYIPSSLRIEKGRWVVEGSSWTLADRTDVTAAYPVTWAPDGRSFTVALGDIAPDEGFYVSYSTQLGYDPVDGEVLRNDARLDGNGTELRTVHSTATYYEAGGSAEGYVFGIRVHKQGPDGEALAGAEFDVVRASSGAVVAHIVTDAAGDAEAGGLLRDDYRLVETAAPAGYRLLDAPIEVATADFDAERTAWVTAVDEREDAPGPGPQPDPQPGPEPEPQPKPQAVVPDPAPAPTPAAKASIAASRSGRTAPRTGDPLSAAVPAGALAAASGTALLLIWIARRRSRAV